VFERIDSAPKSFTISGVIPFTVAFVPTGINAGVLITPCGVSIVPTLALLFVERVFMENVIGRFCIDLFIP
jgi:hypothetical protein